MVVKTLDSWLQELTWQLSWLSKKSNLFIIKHGHQLLKDAILVQVFLLLYDSKSKQTFTSFSMITHWLKLIHKLCVRVKFYRLIISEWMWLLVCTLKWVCTCTVNMLPCSLVVSMRGLTQFRVSSVVIWTSLTFRSALGITLSHLNSRHLVAGTLIKVVVYLVCKDSSNQLAWCLKRRNQVISRKEECCKIVPNKHLSQIFCLWKFMVVKVLLEVVENCTLMLLVISIRSLEMLYLDLLNHLLWCLKVTAWHSKFWRTPGFTYHSSIENKDLIRLKRP